MAVFLKFSEHDFDINVITSGTTETINIRSTMRINEGDLSKEFLEQASWFAWYSALLATQEDKLATKEREVHRHKSDLAMKLRQGKLTILDSREKEVKITEGAIDDYVDQDKKYRVLQDEVQELETTCKKLKLLVSASIQRKDMLTQLGYLQLQEKKQINAAMRE